MMIPSFKPPPPTFKSRLADAGCLLVAIIIMIVFLVLLVMGAWNAIEVLCGI